MKRSSRNLQTVDAAALLGTISNLIKSARNATPLWSGAGLTTSAASSLTGLSVMQSGSDVRVRYTYNGDVDQNGKIDAADYFLVDSGFLAGSTGYPNGDLDFSGKVVAVTGGARGVGAGIVARFLEAGAEVEICGRTAPAELPVIDGRKPVFSEVDVRDPEQVAAWIAAITSRLGRLDVVVNNAGWTGTTPALDVTEDEYDRTMAASLKSVFFACQAAARVMIPQGGGKIINIGSNFGVVAFKTRSVYAAAKARIFAPGTVQGASAMLFYLLVYTLATFGAFAVIIALTRPGRGTVMMDELSGLWARRPWLAAAMAVNSATLQLVAAVSSLTFVLVTDVESLLGLGPAIFLVSSALIAPLAGRTMDRVGRVPVLAAGFAAGAAGAALTALGAQTSSAAAVITGFALVGAAAGAAIGGRRGAGVGAGTGLAVGALAGSGAGNASALGVQERYDHAFLQCMYARGHKIPVSGRFAYSSRPAAGDTPRYSPPPPPPPPPPR